MTSHKLLLFRLRSGVSAEDFESWHQEVNIPFADREPSILSVTLLRLENDGELDGRGYVEVVEVDDDEAYADLQVSERMTRLTEDFDRYATDVRLTEAAVVPREAAAQTGSR